MTIKKANKNYLRTRSSLMFVFFVFHFCSVFFSCCRLRENTIFRSKMNWDNRSNDIEKKNVQQQNKEENRNWTLWLLKIFDDCFRRKYDKTKTNYVWFEISWFELWEINHQPRVEHEVTLIRDTNATVKMDVMLLSITMKLQEVTDRRWTIE